MIRQESPLAAYHRHLQGAALAYQYDPQTGRAVFPPRVLGPASGNACLQWRVSAGLGTVYAATVVHPRDQESYNVVLIDMDEGFRLMSRVEGRPAIGMRVRMRVHTPADGGDPYPVFDSLEHA